MAASSTLHDGAEPPRPHLLATITDQHVLTLLLGSAEPLSRAELASATGLSKPAISASTARLVERGVLRDCGVREGRRGGVATLYDVDPGFGSSLAVAIQSDAVRVQISDFRGTMIGTFEATLDHAATPAAVVRTANALLQQARAGHSAPLLAAAVSIADPVDASSGDPLVWERSVFPAARIRPRDDLDLADARRLVIDNDVNWATIAEQHTGALAGCDDVVYVHLGQGLGAGLLLGGRLFRGHRGLAGEIGYLRSGSADLTERLAGLGLGTPDRYGLDVDRARALFQSDPLSPAAASAIDLLTQAIANLVITVNPEAVAFGGPLSALPAFMEPLQTRISELVLAPPRFAITTTTPLIGAAHQAHLLALDEAGARGAHP